MNAHLNKTDDGRYARRWCMVCGCELPPQTRGRPALYCRADTDRPCARLVKTLTDLRAQAEACMAGVPSTKRETILRSLRGSLRCLAQDLAITAAHQDGSPTRAALVGDPSRDKSPEQFGG